MDEKQRHLWSRAKLWACNTFIVLFLGAMFIKTLAFIPQSLGDLVDPVMRVGGVDQEGWGMFAPTTDTDNFLITAEITYKDGTVATYKSPELRKLSYFRSFTSLREHEYIENVTELDKVEYWPRLKNFIAQKDSGPRPESDVKLIKIWKQMAVIPPPRLSTEFDEEGNPLPPKWQSWLEPPPFDEPSILFERAYP